VDGGFLLATMRPLFSSLCFLVALDHVDLPRAAHALPTAHLDHLAAAGPCRGPTDHDDVYRLSRIVAAINQAQPPAQAKDLHVVLVAQFRAAPGPRCGCRPAPSAIDQPTAALLSEANDRAVAGVFLCGPAPRTSFINLSLLARPSGAPPL